jgi:poly(beta-D-mannuronate) lyase
MSVTARAVCLVAVVGLVSAAPAARAATLPVADDASLAVALAAANPGDTILLADGAYAGFTMTRSGSAEQPIVIRAANPGGAVIASGVLRLSHVSYVTVAGLTITTRGASLVIDGESNRVAVLLEATDHCRLTHSTLRLVGQGSNTHWVMLAGQGEANRIDHNELGPNTVKGHLIWPRGQRAIDGVTPPADRTAWAEGQGPFNPNMPRHTRIDHNYFHDQASGMSETMVLGGLGTTGDYQDTFTTVEQNLLENCDGDAEIISVKASSNTIRYNTVRTSVGTISLRAGNDSAVYGNFMLQGTKSGAAGIKLYEKDHRVFDNYIEGGTDYPLLVGGGDAYDGPGFDHAQVFRCALVNNTVVNPGRQFRVGHGSPLPPVDCVIANNLLVGPGTLYTENLPAVNLTRSQNVVWPFTTSKPGFLSVDPLMETVDGLQRPSSGSPAIDTGDPAYLSLVSEDVLGHPRDAAPDIGAIEISSRPSLRRPLTKADVGPASDPDLAPPSFDPPAGTYTSVQTVAIASSTAGASIRYTTDGTTPSADNGIVYTGPVTVDFGTTTLEAVALAPGLLDSAPTTGTYVVNDVTAPALSLPGDIGVEATGPGGAVVTFKAGAIDNRDGIVPVVLSPASGSTFPLGTTTVTATAQDAAGNIAVGTFTVTVRDTTAPAVVGLASSPRLLVPSVHRMVAVRLSVDARDIVDPAPRSRIVSVASNEPVIGTGPEDVAPDWEVTGDLTLNLRAEEAPGGTGRVYTLVVESRDFSGNVATRTILVPVLRLLGTP